MTSEASPAAILIHFSGVDRPGLTAALTTVLAGHAATVNLDAASKLMNYSGKTPED